MNQICWGHKNRKCLTLTGKVKRSETETSYWSGPERVSQWVKEAGMDGDSKQNTEEL